MSVYGLQEIQKYIIIILLYEECCTSNMLELFSQKEIFITKVIFAEQNAFLKSS